LKGFPLQDILLRYCIESNYHIIFNKNNGSFVRFGENNVDPFYNVIGPELLDISLSNFCERECNFCYRKSNKNGQFMPFDDYKIIMKQAEEVGVLQVALGGGNPNQHPEFIKILNTTREHNIIPNYTTNGQGMTDEIYKATKELCGAIAVSWYEPYIDAKNVIENAKKLGIKTNIHFLLSKTTIKDAIDLIENHDDILNTINALVFLNYKPIHSPESACLSDDDDIKLFFDLIKRHKNYKIGFDSCMISYLPLMKEELVLETVDFCEAGRFSGYISENLLLYPCSFMNDISNKGIDLKTTSLIDGWQNGDEFISIRQRLDSPGSQNPPIVACKTCDSYSFCHGGCQILNINRCRN
jgi:radical SAM protein with 4Fe4S-binding SPASM domain